jgi:inosine-uridine nucleoside N-ribohydrolase
MMDGCGKQAITLLMVLLAWTLPTHAAEKVILDTDFTTIGDDGQAFVMLAQEHAAGGIELLGLTIVSGNDWLEQEVVDALRAVERMGLADAVGVHAGAALPLLHDPLTYEAEKATFGWGYGGAFRSPRPREPADLKAPPDGFARTSLRAEGAVEFIVDQVKRHPHEVTILAVAPLTNLALAFRSHPEIVPLIKRIVYMGGAIDMPGNVTPAAEFNWWFDPEAARIVLRQPIDQVVVPNDVCEQVAFRRDVVERIAAAGTVVAALLGAAYLPRWQKDPAYLTYTWDAIAAAYLLDPSIATDVRELWLDVDANHGPDYGRALGYRRNPPLGAQKIKVVFGIDQQRFWARFEDYMTRKVPVTAKSE